MLDNEKKNIIEAEERYRHEFAQKLQAEVASAEQSIQRLDKSFWSKLNEVLNSNFGLWLLSSVFISGGAAMYQITQHHYESKITTQKELLTCEFEIANRLNSMRFLLKKAKTIGDAQFALTPITKSFGAVSTEYDHVNIAVLYFKVYQLTGIRDVSIGDKVRELEEKNLIIQSGNPKSPFEEADRKRLLELVTALQTFESEQINARKR